MKAVCVFTNEDRILAIDGHDTSSIGSANLKIVVLQVKGHVSLGPPKTGSSQRRVTLPRSVAEELSQHLATWPTGEDGLVFTSPCGGPLRRTNFRRKVWLPAVEKAGLGPLRFHDLRHSHAALLIAQGEHPKVIADRLGHSSPMVTMTTYAHLFPGLDEQAADRLDSLRAVARTDLRRTPADVTALPVSS